MSESNRKNQQFHELYVNNRQKLYRFAYSYVRDSMVAEDIVMESFMHYWEHSDSIREEASPMPYILTCVKNKCLNHLKAQQVRRRAQTEIISVSDKVLKMQVSSLTACDPQQLFSEEAQQIIEKAIAELPDQTRDVFIRSRFMEQSYKEITAETGIPFRKVDYELRKASKMLAEKLKTYLTDLLPIIFLALILL